MRSQPYVLSDMPKDREGPVFRAPWEATAFAITVRLSESGYFSWPEWVEVFSQEIRHAESHEHFDADHDDGDEYYHIWLEALEKIVTSRKLLASDELKARLRYLIDNPVPHDHVARREPISVA